jgi:hypothetical protein
MKRRYTAYLNGVVIGNVLLGVELLEKLAECFDAEPCRIEITRLPNGAFNVQAFQPMPEIDGWISSLSDGTFRWTRTLPNGWTAIVSDASDQGYAVAARHEAQVRTAPGLRKFNDLQTAKSEALSLALG